MTSSKSLLWIGDFPSTWEVMPNKALVRKKKISVGAEAADYPLLSLTKGGVIVRNLEDGGKFPESFNSYQRVSVGDLVTCLFDVPETPRTIGLSPHDGMITGAYDVFEFTDRINPRYFEYYYLALDGRKGLSYFYSGLRNVIRTPVFLSIPMPVPPLDEQKAIADFLDRELAQIDALISANERFIDLLMERHKAQIIRISTKGTVPNPKLIDTNHPWIGHCPSHWEVKKIKRLSRVLRGASPRPIEDEKYFDENGEYGWVRISDVSKSGAIVTETEQRLSELGAASSVKLDEGQLFLSIAGSYGKPGIAGAKLCIHDGFVWFPDLDSNLVDSKWLYWLFASGQLFDGLGKLGTQVNLNTEIVGSVMIPVPPLREQKEIANHLDELEMKFKYAFENAENFGFKLHERRQSLISSAVTGKIDVRKVS